MAAKQWYFQETDGAVYGPLSGVELRRLVHSGQVRRETLVTTDSSDRWIAAGQVKGLFAEREPDPGQAPATASASQHHGYSKPQGPTPNNVFALASLISGILGWTIVPAVGAAVAIVTGHIALRQIERSDGREDGKIMAVIGLILGYIEAVLLFLAAISLFILGIGISGFLGAFFHHAERAASAEAKRRQMEPPKVVRPRAFAPSTPPFPNFGENAFEKAKALEHMPVRERDGDAEGASPQKSAEDRIAVAPQDKSEEPPFELEGSWDVTGPRLRGAYIIEFATKGAVTVRHAFGKSSIAPWSYRDGSIRLGGSIRVNEIRIQGPWKARWRSGDEIDVVDPDGQKLTLKRRTP